MLAELQGATGLIEVEVATINVSLKSQRILILVLVLNQRHTCTVQSINRMQEQCHLP